jgi:histone H3/H4
VADTPSYVAASKVKEKIKEAGLRTAGDASDALNAKVDALISEAVNRAKNNSRGTVKPTDF